MYIIGILIGLYLQISVALLLIALGLLIVFLYFIKVKKRYILLIIIVFIGAIYIRILDNNFNVKYSKVDDEIIVEGIVIDSLQDKDYKYTFTIEVEKINGNDFYKKTKLLVNIKKSKLHGELPQFGDKIEIEGIFERPNIARNYKGFNYAQYLKSKRIYGTLDVNSMQIIEKDTIKGINKLLYLLQQNMKRNLTNILNKDEAALCIRNINRRARRHFRRDRKQF